MAARRCTLCGINYPDRLGFDTCPVHGSETDYLDRSPTTDWEKESARMLKQLESDEEAAVWGPLLDVKVTHRDGQLFVKAWDVYDLIHGILVTGELFRVGRQVFEVLGKVGNPPEYWVAPLETAVTEEGIVALLGSG